MSAAPNRIWRAPVALGVLTAAGLAAGLLGDGVWDWMSAAALAVPVLVGVRYAVWPRS
jgi:hypothetical protein